MNKERKRRKRFTRAQRKKERQNFKVGDVVTWGLGIVSHRIVEVTHNGVFVDITAYRNASLIAHKCEVPASQATLFVSFDGNNRDKSGRGPIRYSDQAPDVVRPMCDPLSGCVFNWLSDDERKTLFG